MLKLINKVVYGMRVHQIPGGECHRHETGFEKEMMRFGISVIFGLFGMDAGRCADELWWFFHACAMVFPLN